MKKETENKLKKVKATSLKMVPPFETLFSMDTETYKHTYSQIYVNMDLLGFDKTQPIIVWKRKNIVIDGHTRLRAAQEKEIKEVWIIEKEFLNEDDAIQYAIHLQRDRRKLTDGDILQLVSLLDRRHPPGRPSKNASVDAVSNPSRTSNIDDYHKGLMKLVGIPDDKPQVGSSRETPYPEDVHPKTAVNVAIHNKIPSLNGNAGVEAVDFGPPKGQSSKLEFEGDLRKGLSLFKEWAYGRSDDITATLIGTSRAKVDKCRQITDCKNEELREDLRDKVLRGKLTINRACSILKNNGKRRNGNVQKRFQKNVFVHTKNASINLDSVKWIILGTNGTPPKENQHIPKDSIILPKK